MGPVAVAVLLVALIILVGVHRARRDEHFDPLHPLLYPTLYVTFATLAPTAWLWSRGDLGYIERRLLSSNTPMLMALSVVGFALGAAIPFRPVKAPPIPRDGRTLVHAGRLILLLPFCLAGAKFLRDTVLIRGQHQNEGTSPLVVAAFIFAPTSFALIAAGRSDEARPFSRGELLGALTLMGLLGLNGSRGAAVAVALIIAFAYVDRAARRRILPLLIGFVGLVAFAERVAVYRESAVGQQTNLSTTEVVLRDLGSVAFTTGVTARLVGRTSQYFDGSTLTADIVRQIPSPVANMLLGGGSDTGAIVFRNLYGVPDNVGYGYSIPAEGYLNFGTVGALALPFAAGALLAWLYARATFAATRSSELTYFIAIATLPFAWRSDVLGAVKGVLYPMIVVWLVLVMARSMRRLAERRRERDRLVVLQRRE
jgi:hypothetical protein